MNCSMAARKRTELWTKNKQALENKVQITLVTVGCDDLEGRQEQLCSTRVGRSPPQPTVKSV